VEMLKKYLGPAAEDTGAVVDGDIGDGIAGGEW